MGIVVRLPKNIYKEIDELKRELNGQGIDVSFPQAATIWYRKMKKLDTVPKKWKFPEFT